MPTTLRDETAAAARLCDDGYAALEAGRFEEAAALLDRARALDPGAPLAHYRTALLHMDTGRLREALDALETAIDLQPDDPRAHNNRGSVLQQMGRTAEAEAAFARALALGPQHPQPYVNLGHLLEAQGRAADAVRLYQTAIARGLDPEVFGHHAAAAGGRVTERAPERWVRETFDNFAPAFDSHMRSLGYRVPAALAALLRPRLPTRARVLDLGCGTGQCGAALAGAGRRLVGVDLSPKMLAIARARRCYDELACAEVHDWLRGAPDASFDAVTATDVLIYVGRLDALFREAARVLRAGGWLAFSTEECDSGDYTLRPTGRYAHALGYVRRLADPSFAVAATMPLVLRADSGRPVAGRIYVLQRR